MIYWLRRLEHEKRIPTLPVYVDSPMAAAALEFYKQRMNELDPDLGGGWKDVCAFCTTRLTVVETSEQSKAVTASREPSIIIAASGMATGGRVLHHLAEALPDGKNTVLFVGYQAAGTRGRSLVDGIHEVKMLGRVIPVMADHRARGFHVGPRRRQRSHAMAVWHRASTKNDVPRPRRTNGPPRAGRKDCTRAFLARSYCAAPGTGRPGPGIG